MQTLYLHIGWRKTGSSAIQHYLTEAGSSLGIELVPVGLRAQTLVRLTVEGRRVVAQESLVVPLQKRIRDVRQGPDGWIYLVTDGVEGQIFRLER